MNRMWLLTGFAVVFFIFILSCSKDKSAKPNNPTVPELTTATITAITQTTAQCGGTVTSDGGANIFYRGVCWSTNPIPSYSDMKTYDGIGTGTFASSITGLLGITRYYVRAYAMNDAGLGYGAVDSFTTTDSIGTMTDIDDNIYKTVKIGSQWWMAENLKVTHYRNGETIDNVTSDSIWQTIHVGHSCSYNNDTINITVYGRLYNWFAVTDSNILAPEGWHVPSDTEWQSLADYLGAYSICGGKLKESGTAHWESPNTGATNESGFTALPGGYRSDDGRYEAIGVLAYFWTSTGPTDTDGWGRHLHSFDSIIDRNLFYGRSGFSIRCIKD